MAGARNGHDDIVVNLVADLRDALRGSGWRPFTGDGRVETLPGQIRRPDVGVDGGPRDPNAMKAAGPRFVAEVPSPSTRDVDAFERPTEYRAVASLRHILLIEPNAAEVRLWSRDGEGAWTKARSAGLGEVVPLPGLGITPALADLYDGVSFPARPRPVLDEAPDGASGPAA